MVLDMKTGIRDDLFIAANVLMRKGNISDIDELLEFLEKPWKFGQEIEEAGYEVVL